MRNFLHDVPENLIHVASFRVQSLQRRPRIPLDPVLLPSSPPAHAAPSRRDQSFDVALKELYRLSVVARNCVCHYGTRTKETSTTMYGWSYHCTSDTPARTAIPTYAPGKRIGVDDHVSNNTLLRSPNCSSLEYRIQFILYINSPQTKHLVVIAKSL